ncbi:nucleotidyltransferase substrate binding protein [Pedobacter arcticus]|uniref:nucleotidyltransferase substrate binding protein n=1 Tax=Pedobacter arcticus TaxID=752140 RepID=UPI000315CCDC|nr:nucleotidyltransferase substrate binding protein [Pedobacter arcticus]
MELKQKFELELLNLKQAIATYAAVLTLTDDTKYTAIELDAIKNGKLQKFEYCTELSWKVSKVFLELRTAEIFISPKLVYKNLLLNKLISEPLYKMLLNTLEDRNKLSHIYKEEMYNEVYKNVNTHLGAFKALLKVLSTNQNQP